MANSKRLETGEVAYCAEFSPYQESCSLLGVGEGTQLLVKTCNLRESSLQQGEGLLRSLEFEDVFNLHVGDRVNHFSWSPASRCEEDHTRLHFCTASSDCKIRVYTSDLNDIVSQLLDGHNSYINDLSCHPTDPTTLASVGDDNQCRVWDIESNQLRVALRLTSPGVSVSWHPHDPMKLLLGESVSWYPHDPMKLLVAEKCGRIRFYDITTETPVMSLDVTSPPLMSADWAPSNSLRVGGVANGNWCLWDISKSSQPLEVKPAHHGAAIKFRWCPQSDQVFATIGHGSNQVKVHHTGHQKVPITSDLPVANDLSWHARLPLLAVASDCSVNLWSVEI